MAIASSAAEPGDIEHLTPEDVGPGAERDAEPGRELDDEPAALPPVITLTAPVPAMAAASPGELALVLDNLLSNARRYARTRIWVSVLPAGRMVRLLVEDDGPGVPEQDRARVFDRFTRLEADRGGVSGGAGLGLALVAALMAGRGGTVRMTESPHGGARVEARWPVADETEDDDAVDSAGGESARPDTGPGARSVELEPGRIDSPSDRPAG
jgi:signal transduction histidine kinase